MSTSNNNQSSNRSEAKGNISLNGASHNSFQHDYKRDYNKLDTGAAGPVGAGIGYKTINSRENYNNSNSFTYLATQGASSSTSNVVHALYSRTALGGGQVSHTLGDENLQHYTYSRAAVAPHQQAYTYQRDPLSPGHSTQMRVGSAANYSQYYGGKPPITSYPVSN